MDWLVEELWKEVSMAFSGLNLQNLFWVSRPANKTKHIKNATWPEGCGQRNKKTRKRENRKTERFFSGTKIYGMFGTFTQGHELRLATIISRNIIQVPEGRRHFHVGTFAEGPEVKVSAQNCR